MKPLKQSELLDTILSVVHADPKAHVGRGPGRARADDVPHLPPLRVLLAEDNLVNQRLAVRLLEKAGHAVFVAGNGRQALHALDRERFDVVLMDVQMPELGGMEATEAIRQREREMGGHIPIIALTAHAMKGDRERCLAAGMDGYVAKPIRDRELFQTIEQVLRIHGPASLVPLMKKAEGAVGEEDTPPPGPLPEAERGSTKPVWPPLLAGEGVGGGVASNPRVRKEGAPGKGAPGEENIVAEDFNRAVALERCGDDAELLRELIDMFLKEIPGWMAALGAGLAAGDAEVVERTAHTIKGAVGTFGATPAWDAAFRLETIGRDNTLAEAGPAWEEMQGVIERLKTALAAFQG